MTNIKLITVTNAPEHATRLIKSAEKQGFEVHIVQTEWRGFGTKVIELYNYLKSNPDITHFVLADAFDVYAIGSHDEFYNKIASECAWDRVIFSCEKACWPDPSLDVLYDKTNSDWKYLNSGLFYAKSGMFIDMVDRFRIDYTDDDQLYYTRIWLTYLQDLTLKKYDIDKLWMQLDNECRYFQSYSFIADGDFSYDDRRPFNLKTKQMPVFFHGNGKTDMSLLERYL